MSQENQNICIFFKYGFCKFKKSCRNKHNEEECKSKVCSSEDCSKRHPKPCFYWVKFGNCKLGVKCAYKHDKNEKIVKIIAHSKRLPSWLPQVPEIL